MPSLAPAPARGPRVLLAARISSEQRSGGGLMPQTAQQGCLRPCAGARVAPFQVAARGGQEAFHAANLGLALGVHVGLWCPGLL